MKNKIALLVDSSLNIPDETLAQYGVYELPLTIIYDNQSFADKIEISSSEIYNRLDTEQPTTSLPKGDSIYSTLQQIIDDGYSQLIVMTISSRLSGTNNAIKLMAEEFPSLDTQVFDTKTAAIGGGMQAIFVKELIDQGKSFAELADIISTNVAESRIFFYSANTYIFKKRW